MKILQLVPEEGEVDFQTWLGVLEGQRRPELNPFHPDVIDFCGRLSQGLFRDDEARGFAELQTLAYWMRRGELLRMRVEFVRQSNEKVLTVPRGLVFHIPPANVQTVFVYSWLMSILAGNRNVIRLSRRDSPQTEILLRLFRRVLLTAPASLRRSSLIVQYGHEPEITAALSRLCDLRVIWGGDATVEAVRQAPLAPHARDLTFPDRYSLCALEAEAVLGLNGDELASLAAGFYNDTFWFDQMACSSPRLLFWCGREEACAQASERFLAAVQRQLETRGYDAGVAPRIAKLTFGCRAVLDRKAKDYREHGGLSVLSGGNLAALSREHCGGGLLYEFQAPGLLALCDVVTRRDQTLTHFGFAGEDLRALAGVLNGTGIDRMVPVGQALQFQRNWDGVDLLREMTREVYLGIDSPTTLHRIRDGAAGSRLSA